MLILDRLLGRSRSAIAPASGAAPGAPEMTQQFEFRSPTPQNAVDAVPGWTSSFPAPVEVSAGMLATHADGRITWALDRFGPLEGRSVLEIGPLDGMHTHMMESASRERGPLARIDAVEANRNCFLRCLITKELLGMTLAQFHLGDVMGWLEEDRHYDLIVASGVLYHMNDPAEFLRRVAGRTDALFLWTHYYDAEAMPPDDVRHAPIDPEPVVRDVAGLGVRQYRRTYWNAQRNASFCGGIRDLHYWMHREDIVALLERLGFGSIVTAFEEPDHPAGPALALFARRTSLAVEAGTDEPEPGPSVTS